MLGAAAVITSCNKQNIEEVRMGELSFADFALEYSDEVVTKATSAASGNYTIIVNNSDDVQVLKTTYTAVKADDNKISLPAGEYTLIARSTEDDVPTAEFEQPVYGVSKEFSIEAGQTTVVGSLTCTLLQCKVTVAYDDAFLSHVTGNGTAQVEVTTGYPLTYDLTYGTPKSSYDQAAGYFKINNGENTTMTVTFKGSIDGKSQKMTKSFTGIAAKQWRQVKFVQKVDEEGTATFDITIEDYVDDEVLNNAISGQEEIKGDDPNAPKGDGGITLGFDYEQGCDAAFTDLENIVFPIIASTDAPTVSLKLMASIPNGVKKFTVNIDSNNEAFMLAVTAAEATNLDLINYTPTNEIIFEVVPFPHGAALSGATDLHFDLSNAQPAMMIGPYYGVHNFTMNITDMQGCKKSIPVKMIVNEE